MTIVVVFEGINSKAADETIIDRILNEKGEFSCLSSKETELFNLVNQYRIQHGLAPIPNSRSLGMVARIHAVDLYENKPGSGKDPRGQSCSMHSWSTEGFWEPVCYTRDHYYARLMWKKPREITSNVYRLPGFENVYWTTASEVLPRMVIAAWAKSPEHRALILESGKWRETHLNAFGVAVYRNIAIMWVGCGIDPLGPMNNCS